MKDAAGRPHAAAGTARQLRAVIVIFVIVTFGFSSIAWLPLVLQTNGGLGRWVLRTFSLTGLGRAHAFVIFSITLSMGIGLLV